VAATPGGVGTALLFVGVTRSKTSGSAMVSSKDRSTTAFVATVATDGGRLDAVDDVLLDTLRDVAYGLLPALRDGGGCCCLVDGGGAR